MRIKTIHLIMEILATIVQSNQPQTKVITTLSKTNPNQVKTLTIKMIPALTITVVVI